jgi:TonB family protein
MIKRGSWLFAAVLILLGTILGATAQTKSPDAPTLAPKYLNWLNDDVNFIITAKEKEVFLKLQTDKERDIFIEALWKQRDPTPNTPENEFKTEYYRRLQYADRMFGTQGIAGRKTEPGLVYVISGTQSPAADSWVLKMRIFEVPGKGGSEPVKAVTSSYLKYSLTATIKTEYDLAEEMKQIQKTFNYPDVKLLTEADFSWKRNDRSRAFHIFRLDGREYLVLITPVDVARKLTFRIEVNEQGEKTKSNLLDTEFSIPEKNIGVFGFEDSKGNVYFLSFRATGWTPSLGGAVGGVMGGVVGGTIGGYVGEVEAPIRAMGEIKPPKLIKQVDPRYPEIARQAFVEGSVILEAQTDIYGRVRDIKVLRSIPLLDQAAIDAVRQWVYEPMIIDGKPRGVIFTTTVRFELKDKVAKAEALKEGAPLRLTGDVKGPKLLKQVDPIFPEVARQSRVEGTVILEVTTDIYGRVRDLKVLRSIPLLDQAAIDAVRQWVYEPPIINGKPISVTFAVSVVFTLK